MSIFLSTAEIGSLKLGNSDVSRVMLGNTEVWSAFSPLSLSPAIWLSDTGTDDSLWPDLSGNGVDASQSLSGLRPSIVTNAINGRQVRRFDGSDDYMEFLEGKDIARNVAGITVVAAYKWTTNPTTSKAVFSAQGNGTAGLRVWLGAGLTSRKLNIRARRVETDNAQIANSSANNTSNFIIHTGIVSYTGQLLTQFINGAADGSTAATFAASNSADTESNNVAIGANHSSGNFADIDLAEMLVFKSALSTTDRQAIEGYLSAKYNIALA